MPARALVARELAELLGVLAHPDKLLIVQALNNREIDVNTLSEVVGLPQSRMSQHLSQLKAHRIVVPRREGRHVYYRLVDDRIATWLMEGLRFIRTELGDHRGIADAVATVRAGDDSDDGEDSDDGTSSDPAL